MHEYVIGRSGFGKSTFLENHALRNEGGFVFLDPHGQSAERIADALDCIYWEPSDTNFPVCYNPVKDVALGERHLRAYDIVSSLKAIWSESWGPRMEQILYHAVLLCCDNNSSLLDIPTLLTDETFRHRFLRKASFRDFWDQQFEEWDDRQRNEYIQPVMNKVGQFSANPVLSTILSENSISLLRVLEKGQRLVVNLSKGKLGDEPSHLLGAFLISGVAQAAGKRKDPKPFTIYADEFQRFVTQTFEVVLSESRKAGISLVLAHQFLGQIPDVLRQAILGNVGKMTVFCVSAEDAEVLAREFNLHEADTMGHGFHSDFCEEGLHTPRVLSTLPPFHAWSKEGLETMQPPIDTVGRLHANIRQTRAAYSRMRGGV